MSKARGQTPWRQERRIAQGKQNGRPKRGNGRFVGSDEHANQTRAIDWDKLAKNMGVPLHKITRKSLPLPEGI